MYRRPVCLVAGLLCALLAAASSADAGWIESGTPVITISNYQYSPMIVPDGEGGAIIGWLDQSAGNDDICATSIMLAAPVVLAFTLLMVQRRGGRR